MSFFSLIRRRLSPMRAFVFVFCFVFVFFSVLPFGSSAASAVSISAVNGNNFEFLFNVPNVIGQEFVSTRVSGDGIYLDYSVYQWQPQSSKEFVLPFKFSKMPSDERSLYGFFNWHLDYEGSIFVRGASPHLLCFNSDGSYIELENSLVQFVNATDMDIRIDFDYVSEDCVCFAVVFVADIYYELSELETYVYGLNVFYGSDSPEYQHNYSDFGSASSEMDNFQQSEDALLGDAAGDLDLVKGSLFDTSMWNPDNFSILKGFITASRIFETFSEIPQINGVLRYSLIFGILAFVLGLVVLFLNRSRK